MKRFLIGSYLMVIGMLATNSAAAQVAAVKFTVKVPRPDTFTDRNVFLAGSFNGWSSHDSFYIMKQEDETTYSLLVPLFQGKPYTYKYTRGSWNNVETKINDSDISNRRLYSNNGAVI